MAPKLPSRRSKPPRFLSTPCGIYRQLTAGSLTLYTTHEKSIDEVAHILNIPSSTVKTRMFYARKRLAQRLSRLGQGAPELLA